MSKRLLQVRGRNIASYSTSLNIWHMTVIAGHLLTCHFYYFCRLNSHFYLGWMRHIMSYHNSKMLCQRSSQMPLQHRAVFKWWVSEVHIKCWMLHLFGGWKILKIYLVFLLMLTSSLPLLERGDGGSNELDKVKWSLLQLLNPNTWLFGFWWLCLPFRSKMID